MRGVNKAIIVGNLGADPEVRATQNGKAVTTLSIATSEQWKDKQSGQPQERTEWHRVVMYDRLAEIAGEYLRKGSKVYIEGSIHTRKWQDKDGQDRYTTEIKALQMQMLDGRNDSSGAGGQSSGAPGEGSRQSGPTSPPSAGGGDFNEFDDDIPF